MSNLLNPYCLEIQWASKEVGNIFGHVWAISVLFLAILVVGKPTTASIKINFEFFPADIIFLKPIKLKRLRVVYTKSFKQ